MQRTLDVLTACAASAIRLGAGIHAARGTRQPENMLILYEYEPCRYCRYVREALTELDLDALILPCPKGGTVHRPKAPLFNGNRQFPVLIDTDTDRVIHESRVIVEYLHATYGAGKPPLGHRLRPLALSTSEMASALRKYRGSDAIPSRQPELPLELYSFESSPFCRLVRETLCELELAYVVHNVGKGGMVDWLIPGLRERLAPDGAQTTAHRQAFVERSGKMMVPYLVDPNTGVEMFESADIQRYLLDTYGR